MSVTIDYQQTRTIEEGPIFRVKTEVTYVSGIARQVFVMNTELGRFEHVATVWDMENVVPDKQQAINEGREYYRAESCDVTYETQVAALEFAEYTRYRIADLAARYSNAVSEFAGVYNYHAEVEL